MENARCDNATASGKQCTITTRDELMILEKNFIQMQFDAAKKYMDYTAQRYTTEGERTAADASYIQGRVDVVADMESLVGQYNEMLKERNKLAKELAKVQAKTEPGYLGL